MVSGKRALGHPEGNLHGFGDRAPAFKGCFGAPCHWDVAQSVLFVPGRSGIMAMS